MNTKTSAMESFAIDTAEIIKKIMERETHSVQNRFRYYTMSLLREKGKCKERKLDLHEEMERLDKIDKMNPDEIEPWPDPYGDESNYAFHPIIIEEGEFEDGAPVITFDVFQSCLLTITDQHYKEFFAWKMYYVGNFYVPDFLDYQLIHGFGNDKSAMISFLEKVLDSFCQEERWLKFDVPIRRWIISQKSKESSDEDAPSRLITDIINEWQHKIGVKIKAETHNSLTLLCEGKPSKSKLVYNDSHFKVYILLEFLAIRGNISIPGYCATATEKDNQHHVIVFMVQTFKDFGKRIVCEKYILQGLCKARKKTRGRTLSNFDRFKSKF